MTLRPSTCLAQRRLALWTNTSLSVMAELAQLSENGRQNAIQKRTGGGSIPKEGIARSRTGKASAIRFSTLDVICEALSYQRGDILRFRAESSERVASKRSTSR